MVKSQFEEIYACTFLSLLLREKRKKSMKKLQKFMFAAVLAAKSVFPLDLEALPQVYLHHRIRVFSIYLQQPHCDKQQICAQTHIFLLQLLL